MSEPSTDAELYDLIHRLFGVGDWYENDATPWFKIRMTEIAKVKSIRKKRRLSISDVAMLADHCHRKRRRIRTTFDLLQYWPEAVRERSANERSQIERDIERALEIERQRPDGQEWVDRLLLAQGGGRQVLLNRWKTERE